MTSNASPSPQNTVTASSPKVSPSPSAENSAIIFRDVSPAPTPTTSPLKPDAGGVQAAIDVVHEYYAAVNAGDFRRAYELWEGNGKASGQTFEQFREGYADTAGVKIDTSGEPGDIEGAAGSQYINIPLLITAQTRGGQSQKFWGEYVLRRSMVEGAEARGQWRLYSAKFREL